MAGCRARRSASIWSRTATICGSGCRRLASGYRRSRNASSSWKRSWRAGPPRRSDASLSLLDCVRSDIRGMAGYVPGEQPRSGGIVKLNTNENPYPPSPAVFDAVRAALTGDRLRKYPDPSGTRFRETAGRVLGVDPDGIVIGNGSDDLLTILTRTFVPAGGTVASFFPSYLLYRTLAGLQGARFVAIPFEEGWTLPRECPEADLVYLANPNSPSGTMVGKEGIEAFPARVLVVDEAYADFADDNALPLASSGKAIVTRTLSKSYSLAGIRFGFAVATPAVARELNKMKDSYNCDALSLEAATAALADQAHMRENRRRILATRAVLERGMAALGFRVTPSSANFVWCLHERPVRPMFEELKRRDILVRLMAYEGWPEGLRVTVGTDEEIGRLLEELRGIV
ncbi:MAG: histidinol-phosphate transaminase [Gemmataceae bacterium]|nr:histidinol-phosphate transaminase [Gemmataceae bacterium]